MELEVINKLYLELSQIATAQTKKELDLEKAMDAAMYLIETRISDFEVNKAYEILKKAIKNNRDGFM